MAIQRWDPLRDLIDLQDKVNRMFEEILSRSSGADGPAGPGPAGWRPPVDLFEEPGRYVLRADLPGIAAADVELQIDNGTLSLSGERKLDGGVARESFLRVERPHGPFTVQVALPPSVDPQQIQAVHRNGVVEVVLPKRKPSAPSKVEIAPGS